MKLNYHADSDSLEIDLADRPAADSWEVEPGIVLDFGREGRLGGIDIDRARRNLALDTLEVSARPLTGIKLTG
jgi:uncharacterized protein YuzE